MTRPQISTVLFDADGVLQFHEPLFPHFDRRYGWSRQRLEDFFTYLFQEVPDYDPTLVGDGDLREVLAPVLADWGWTTSVETFVQDWLTQGAVPDPAAMALVATLRRHGVRCGLATNQEALRARFMDQELGYERLFDHRFYSADLGYAKPDQEFFRAVLADLRLDPRQILFVDDRAENVAGAREAGMYAELHGPGDRLRDLLAAYSLPV